MQDAQNRIGEKHDHHCGGHKNQRGLSDRSTLSTLRSQFRGILMLEDIFPATGSVQP